MSEQEIVDLIIPMGERLDRIAVALEQLVALAKPSALAAFHAESAPQAPRMVQGPVDPEPPFPVPTVAPSAGVPPTRFYHAGDVHAQGHRPLKENNKGIYCPTKLSDGTWCAWRPA